MSLELALADRSVDERYRAASQRRETRKRFERKFRTLQEFIKGIFGIDIAELVKNF